MDGGGRPGLGRGGEGGGTGSGGSGKGDGGEGTYLKKMQRFGGRNIESVGKKAKISLEKFGSGRKYWVVVGNIRLWSEIFGSGRKELVAVGKKTVKLRKFLDAIPKI